jgi:hypothetical protein
MVNTTFLHASLLKKEKSSFRYRKFIQILALLMYETRGCDAGALELALQCTVSRSVYLSVSSSICVLLQISLLQLESSRLP